MAVKKALFLKEILRVSLCGWHIIWLREWGAGSAEEFCSSCGSDDANVHWNRKGENMRGLRVETYGFSNAA